jgi:hypothetical protein
MVIAWVLGGGSEMQTFEDVAWMAADRELAPEETRDLPFFGFVAGSLISLAIWSALAWTIWAMVD